GDVPARAGRRGADAGENGRGGRDGGALRYAGGAGRRSPADPATSRSGLREHGALLRRSAEAASGPGRRDAVRVQLSRGGAGTQARAPLRRGEGGADPVSGGP